MAYEPLGQLISQAPTSKQFHLTTDNWPVMRKKIKTISRDPSSDDFNWWFWCGINNKKELMNKVKSYQEVSGKLLFFKNKREKDITDWFNSKIKNSVHQHIVSKSFYQINVDVERVEQAMNNDENKKNHFKNIDMVYRILYTIFSQRYVLMEGYSQIDLYYLSMVINIVDSLKNSQVDIYKTKLNKLLLKELLYYSILTKLLDLKISMLYAFGKEIKINSNKVELVKKKNKNFLLENFFDFLFTSMFFKFVKDKKTKEVVFNNKKKEIFSYFLEYFKSSLWSPIPFYRATELYNPSPTTINNIKEVIGQTIINNDIIYYIIYLISFWCEYFKYDDFDNHPAVDTNETYFLSQEFYGIVPQGRSSLIYDNALPITKFNEIKKYLLKEKKKMDGTVYTQLEEIIKLAKKKKTKKKYKNGIPIKFKFPSKLLNYKPKKNNKKEDGKIVIEGEDDDDSDEKKQAGGRRKNKTIKYKFYKRNKTLKLY